MIPEYDDTVSLFPVFSFLSLPFALISSPHRIPQSTEDNEYRTESNGRRIVNLSFAGPSSSELWSEKDRCDWRECHAFDSKGPFHLHNLDNTHSKVSPSRDRQILVATTRRREVCNGVRCKFAFASGESAMPSLRTRCVTVISFIDKSSTHLRYLI